MKSSVLFTFLLQVVQHPIDSDPPPVPENLGLLARTGGEKITTRGINVEENLGKMEILCFI